MIRHTLNMISWLIVLWICKVFLFSLPYKFSMHPDTQHIFSMIGGWMQGFLGENIGALFTNYGAYVVGSFELVTSVILLAPVLLFAATKMGISRIGSKHYILHSLGGLMASMVMAGAVFFHLFTPLGVEVIHEGKSDGGSLFYAALSILVLGFVLFFINRIQQNQADPTEL